MRVRKPQEFDPEREYKPGERAIYKGMDYCLNMNERRPKVSRRPRNPVLSTVRPLQDRPGRLHRGAFAMRYIQQNRSKNDILGVLYPKTVITNKKLER